MALDPEFFAEVVEFQWDEGNSQKNWVRQTVTQAEAEQVFFNWPLVVEEARRSGTERRYCVLGRTNAGRMLMVVFTFRGSVVRVISARPMSLRERRVYAEEEGT